MHCSGCGAQIQTGLNYCSRCGAAAERYPTPSSPRPFIFGATVIAFVGLAAFGPLLRMLLNSRLETPAIVLIVIAYLVTLLLMFGSTPMMAWKFAGFGHRPRQQPDKLSGEYAAPVSFRDVNTSQLHSGDPGFGSVTDSTTRTLDEAMAERKSGSR